MKSLFVPRKRLLAALTIMMMLLGTTAFGTNAPSNDGPTRVLINSSDASLLASLKATYGVRWDFESAGFSTTVSAAALSKLQQTAGVSVEIVPVQTVHAKPEGPSTTSSRSVTPNDQTPWGIEAIYNNPNISSTSGGAGRIVAILDTGVNAHLDLKAPKSCLDFTKGVTPKSGCSDGHGHGTHVAGTILAHAGSDGLGIWGVAPAADYFAFKVCGDNGSCFSDDVAAAIKHSHNNGAHIISMSLGGSSPSSAQHTEIKNAVSKGLLVVAAAGNSGPNADTIRYPGAFPESVAVAALREDLAEGTAKPKWNGEELVTAWFSSRGHTKSSCANDLKTFPQPSSAERCIEVAAPGRYVESTMRDGGYATWSGTSMATPHIAGLAAKYWAANTGLSNNQIRAWLQTNAEGYDVTKADIQEGDAADTNAKAGYDITAGFGFPQVGR